MTNSLLPNSNIWFVRGERANVIASYFLEHSVVCMGWGIGPIEEGDSKIEIEGRLARRWPGEKDGTYPAWASQIMRFNRKMTVGDVVATVSTYQAPGRLCHIGIIRSLLIPVEPGPIYDEYHNDYIHKVEWLYQIPTSSLSPYTQRRLGLPPTLYRLNPEASAELRQYYQQKS